MAILVITCPSVDNVKPNVTVTEATGAELVANVVDQNSISILVGSPPTGETLSSHKLQVAVRDAINHFCGENRLKAD